MRATEMILMVYLLGIRRMENKSVERQKRIALDLISYSDLTYWCATASML
jgi:hypothetical protein